MKITTCSNRPILTDCGLENLDYQADTYVGCEHYCYYCYALKEAETDWTKEVRIYPDIRGQLSEELAKISPQSIYMGYKTDPYQPCEEEHRQTRQVLELLLERGFSASILTKSNLVTRDIDLLAKMENASVSVSVAFTDDKIRELFEYRTINTGDRIKALGMVREAGVKTSALICPVIPYISDVIPLVNMLAPLTDSIWIYGLSLTEPSSPNRQNVDDILTRHFPAKKEQIETVIFSKEHAYWTELRQELEELGKEKRLDLRIHL
ncbi:MAG: radical SAM protein [bacterium]|nr:radical SAM protein [bacterium]